jgi:hypothetical protein
LHVIWVTKKYYLKKLRTGNKEIAFFLFLLCNS